MAYTRWYGMGATVLFWRYDPYKELLKASDRIEKAYNLLVGASMIESPEDVSFEVRALIGPMLKMMSRKRDKSKMVFGLRIKAFRELSKGISIIEKMLRRDDRRINDIRDELVKVLSELRGVVEKGYVEGVEDKIRSIADRIHRVEDMLWRMSR